jgi:parallel beta-helix repeat protein
VRERLPSTRKAILLLAAILGSTFAFLPPPVFATTGCGSVITSSTTLSSDIGPCTGSGIIIGNSNVVLNCAGHTITGRHTANSIGIEIVSVNKITVTNCKVAKFEIGFYLYSSSDDTIVGNAASHNGNATRSTGEGFIIGFSSNSSVFRGNKANDNFIVGFEVDLSSYNTLRGNTARGNGWYGFLTVESSNNNLRGNTATGNGYAGFYTYASSSHNVIRLNTANANGDYGYYDGTTGSGTGGTADTYVGDECSSNIVAGSSPTGLCTPQP